MKKAAGFTLIELVIVIVILGILGAVAAPRFLNLQGDAYGANLSSLNSSIKSAMTLGNTKAILEGQDAEADEDITIDGITAAVEFDFGFPSATENGIIAMLQDLDGAEAGTDADDNPTAADDNAYTYILDDTAGTLQIIPTARFTVSATCSVTYTQAVDATTPAEVEVITTGC